MKFGQTFLSLLLLLSLSKSIFAEEFCPTLEDINSAIRHHEKSLRFQGYEFNLQHLGENARVMLLIEGKKDQRKIECHYRFRDRVDNRRIVDTVILTAPLPH
ncbi:MAG: hypothetical protein BGO67_13175 [Alphaproteobacteria bacterium 41-28]|nr:MAG: hypothetical protein BGO67_13175 [Alphaproteobacteria bacterium 41-28]